MHCPTLPPSPRRLLLLALLACAGCESTNTEYILDLPKIKDPRWAIIDTHDLELAVKNDQVVVSDHTDMYVSGGVSFGNVNEGGTASVEPTIIELSTSQTPWNMLDIKIYAGSGNGYPADPTGGVLIASDANPPKKMRAFGNGSGGNPTEFSNVPDYDTADSGYWLWVVVQVRHNGDGATKTINSQRFMSLFQDHPSVPFVDEYSD